MYDQAEQAGPMKKVVLAEKAYGAQANAGITGSKQTADEERSREIGHFIEHLQKTVGENQQLVQALQQALAPILRSEPEVQEKQPAPGGVTPLGDVICRTAYTLSRINGELHSMLRRIEV